MPTSGLGNSSAPAAKRTPTLPAARGSLPPEGAGSPWGGPAANRAPTLPAARGSLPPEGAGSPWDGPAANRAARTRGFTLLELLVVVAVIAIATAGVSFALRDTAVTQLDREAQRLSALLEAARAQSRSSGLPVRWVPVEGGFRFEGVAPGTLPDFWLHETTTVVGGGPLLLGPEPIIGPQALVLGTTAQPDRTLRIATDGLRPFAVAAPPEAAP